MPSEIWIKALSSPPNSNWGEHNPPWGKAIFCLRGMIDIKTEGSILTAIQHYAVWIPPHMDHDCFSLRTSHSIIIYIIPSACGGLPTVSCSLESNKLVMSIINHLGQHPIQEPPSSGDVNILKVLKDQLTLLPVTKKTLPQATDPQLQQVLEYIKENRGENIKINEIAKKFGFSPKTLNRKCQKQLSVTLGEWRLREKVITANELLKEGYKVDVVAHTVGYSTASAFIAMYHKITGQTPAKMKQRHQ